MRTIIALAIAYAGYRAAALFVDTLSFPWLGVTVICLALAIAVLMAQSHSNGRTPYSNP